VKKKLLVALFSVTFCASAFSANFVWTASAPSTAWTNELNWDLEDSYPGAAASDTATINIASFSNPVVLSSNLANALTSLTINAATPNSADVGVQITTAQSNSFGAVTLTGNATYTGYLDFNVSGSASSVTANALSGIDVERGASFTISGAFTVSGDATFDLSAPGASGTGQISAGSYVQNGGTNGSTATVGANGQISTN